MHSHLNEQLAAERVRELRTQAQHSRLSAQAQHSSQCSGCAQAQHSGPRGMRPAQRSTVRHRAGWTLVEIGLRLAGGSPDA
jgi:hypothetical protein